MKLSKRTLPLFLFGILWIAVALILFAYVFPLAIEVKTGLNAYGTRAAYRDDYKQHTTPLPESVIEDICVKLRIKDSSEQCQSNIVVYAPELFDEVKFYFGNLAHQNRTFVIVQERLGTYLDYCEEPYPDGSYVCHYDLRGDNVYPVFFYFDKEDFYFQVIANTGGS